MQKHYASELEAERERSAALQARQDDMKLDIEEMRNSLGTHLSIMSGLANYMRLVKIEKDAADGYGSLNETSEKKEEMPDSTQPTGNEE